MRSVRSVRPIARDLGLHERPDDQIKKAWGDVVLRRAASAEGVRPEVLDSWVKCLKSGLDPFDRESLPIISIDELEQLLIENTTLIEASKHVLDVVEISIRGTGFIVTLSDKNGYVLIARGDSEMLKKAEYTFFKPGCLRTTEHAGTNAIGVCLSERKPVQITGAEHFKIHHHPWTCSSAPIFDSKENLIGVITLSGRSDGKHQHTLALVTATAETIEGLLRERDLMEEKQRLNSALTLILNAIPDGVMAVDSDLRLTHLNSAATRMLGLGDGRVLGKQIKEVVQPEDSVIRALRNRKYFSHVEKTFTCPNGNRSYICSSDPTCNSTGQILGAIITLTEKEEMINFAKNFGGNYAKYTFDDILGHDPKLAKQIELAKIASRTNSRVLVLGESGTGKELFAQAIHNSSMRHSEPFVAVSCAAIPRDLIESELFGYRAGAFTGARGGGHVGKFELANKGTLFLDEVDGLPLDLQAKLLRVLQQGEIVRLGDTRTIPVDVRIIASSNVDLTAEIENSNFREDLYYRLNVVEIFTPPLRQRMGDLDLLVQHILRRLCLEMGVPKPEVSTEVTKTFRSYYWPGNVRELENCIERALLLSQRGKIMIDHLPERIRLKSTDSQTEVIPLKETLKKMIEITLDQCGGNVSMAARELKIARSTLYRKMREFGLA